MYVWGSNSSHQLAEGTLEKILQPKLAQGFSDAQMVRQVNSAVIGMVGAPISLLLTAGQGNVDQESPRNYVSQISNE